MLAENITQSGSVSVSGGNITNGFHPLWLLLIIPIFSSSLGAGDLQIHMILTLACFLDLISMCFLYLLVKKITRHEKLGLVATALLAFNPFLIFQTINGLETALSLLLIIIYLFAYSYWLNSSGRLKENLIIGFLWGCVFLVRSDNVFVLGLTALSALWYWRWRKKAWVNIFSSGIIAIIIAMPWFLWSYTFFGSWMQESGVAVPYAIRQRVMIEYGWGINVFLEETIRQLTYPALWLRGDYSGLPLFVGVLLWIIVLIGFFAHWKKSRTRLEIAIVVPLLGSGIILYLVHAGIRWYPRPWYFIQLSLAFSIIFALVANDILITHLRRFLAINFFLIYFIFSGYIFWGIGYFPWQSEMFTASLYLNENLPQNSTVASFNSGIYAYYSDFDVINLDGVVNHFAFLAVQQKDIIGYLTDNNVDYLIDFDSAIKSDYALFMGPQYPEALQEIKIVGGSENHPLGLLRIYRILP